MHSKEGFGLVKAGTMH